MRKIASVIAIWIMALSSIWSSHSDAYTIAIADTVNKESDTEPTRKKVIWTKALSKSYATIQMQLYYPEWDKTERIALGKLWGKESAWNHEASNPKSTAFGIPQLLKMSPKTPAPRQIERGLDYIKNRYGKPSVAWAHWESKRWY